MRPREYCGSIPSRRVLGSLSHPHIVTAHAFGQCENDCYLVMEWIAGPSLREVLRTRTQRPGLSSRVSSSRRVHHQTLSPSPSGPPAASAGGSSPSRKTGKWTLTHGGPKAHQASVAAACLCRPTEKLATVPTGETEFQFKAGNLNFHSDTYEWLVVSGFMAQYKGNGTINGVAGYTFLLTATDGQITGGGGVDKLRMKIWNTSTSVVVYDNLLSPDGDKMTIGNTQPIDGGSIMIKTK